MDIQTVLTLCKRQQNLKDNQLKEMIAAIASGLIKENPKESIIENEIKQLKKIIQEQTKTISELTQKYQKLQKKQKAEQTNFHILEDLFQKVNLIQSQLSKVHMKESQRFLNVSKQQKQIFSKEWVHPECIHFDRLNLHNNTISTKQQGAYVFGRTPLRQYFSYAVIFSTMEHHGGVGIIDVTYRTKQSLKLLPNFIMYWSHGNIYMDNSMTTNQGLGFKKGEAVVVSVNLKEGIIQWKVGGEIRLERRSALLADRTITWVPFIYLNTKNDKVTIT